MPSISLKSYSSAIGIPEDGRIFVIAVGIEEYQKRDSVTLPSVDFATNDAKVFCEVLSTIYGADRLHVSLLLNNDATFGNVAYEFKRTIAGLGKDDLFIFYYAGHGFHGGGGNRITVWDTHAHSIENTTLLLRDVLFDPLQESNCTRALVFIDACATEFQPLVPGRDVVSSLDAKALESFLSPDRYLGIFLSCEPGQKSYPAIQYSHGIWTYFLLRALRGEAKEALTRNRYVTDTSLRDYLRQEVPRFITKNTDVKGNQNPQAIISSSSTFAIRQVSEVIRLLNSEGDFTKVKIKPTQEFFEHVETKPVTRFPKFDRRHHFKPDRRNQNALNFIRGLAEDEVNEEIQEWYQSTKDTLGLKRRDISQTGGDGEASLDTEYFRCSIETRQSSKDPSDCLIVRRLELRDKALEKIEQIDEIFGKAFNRIVISGVELDYDEVVDHLEDIQRLYEGELDENPAEGRVSYTNTERTKLVFDTANSKIRIESGSKEVCSTLLARAHGLKFTLAGPSVLLLK